MIGSTPFLQLAASAQQNTATAAVVYCDPGAKAIGNCAKMQTFIGVFKELIRFLPLFVEIKRRMFGFTREKHERSGEEAGGMSGGGTLFAEISKLIGKHGGGHLKGRRKQNGIQGDKQMCCRDWNLLFCFDWKWLQ